MAKENIHAELEEHSVSDPPPVSSSPVRIIKKKTFEILFLFGF